MPVIARCRNEATREAETIPASCAKGWLALIVCGGDIISAGISPLATHHAESIPSSRRPPSTRTSRCRSPMVRRGAGTAGWPRRASRVFGVHPNLAMPGAPCWRCVP